MKIKRWSVDDQYLEFDTGDMITFSHVQDCCEFNFADFDQIDDLARHWEFEYPLTFEKVNECGFRFGNRGRMVFVPCYSSQNGYYNSCLDIEFNGELVIEFDDLEII